MSTICACCCCCSLLCLRAQLAPSRVCQSRVACSPREGSRPHKLHAVHCGDRSGVPCGELRYRSRRLPCSVAMMHLRRRCWHRITLHASGARQHFGLFSTSCSRLSCLVLVMAATCRDAADSVLALSRSASAASCFVLIRAVVSAVTFVEPRRSRLALEVERYSTNAQASLLPTAAAAASLLMQSRCWQAGDLSKQRTSAADAVSDNHNTQHLSQSPSSPLADCPARAQQAARALLRSVADEAWWR